MLAHVRRNMAKILDLVGMKRADNIPWNTISTHGGRENFENNFKVRGVNSCDRKQALQSSSELTLPRCDHGIATGNGWNSCNGTKAAFNKRFVYLFTWWRCHTDEIDHDAGRRRAL